MYGNWRIRTLSWLWRISHILLSPNSSLNSSLFFLESLQLYMLSLYKWCDRMFVFHCHTNKKTVWYPQWYQKWIWCFVNIAFVFVFDHYFFFFRKLYQYKKCDRLLAKVIEKQVTINKTPDAARVISIFFFEHWKCWSFVISRPIYDSNISLFWFHCFIIWLFIQFSGNNSKRSRMIKWNISIENSRKYWNYYQFARYVDCS